MLSLEELQAQLDEQVRLNERLREAAEHFVGAVTHDVKNPLAAIKINVQGLKRRLDRGELDPELMADRLTRIEDSLAQVLHLLAAARARVSSTPGEVQAPLRREPIDLVGLTREIAAEFRAARRRAIHLDVAQPVLVGYWDETCLRHTIHELLANAVRFSPGGGDVAVRLQRDEDEGEPCASLCVRDRGIGIPEGDLPSVFDRFYRAENVLGRFPGAGLGLFQVRQDIERHGGRVTVTNAAPGCIVSVRLPTSQP